MAIPLAYNIRNLTVRKTTTVMTALGIALTVAVLVAVLALVDGLKTAFQASGSPLNILVMRKGSNAELSGGLTRDAFDALKAKPGIARGADGQPQASLELVTVINLPGKENPEGMNITLRGLTQTGLDLREHTKIAEGRWFRAGQREVVVGSSVAKRYPDAELGRSLHFGRGDWKVVGVMQSDSSATNSEIYADLNQMAGDFNRQDSPSAALIRATDVVSAQALVNSINDDQRLNSNARTELEYMDSQTSSSAPVQFLGIFVAIVMAVGSCFAAMNTMYAAVARRAKEIGTLRVLGFSQGSILLSFFIESLLLALLGGAIGCLIVLPLNAVTTGITSLTSFSEIAFNFRVGFQAMAIGIGFALVMGAIGGVLPARMAARKEILNALRDI
jgi:ABC-type antimicrobial peptide transport system permease subunit